MKVCLLQYMLRAIAEYGMGNKVSIYGDVYSYDILLLEMFTGKKPIDNSFHDCLNLHDFVMQRRHVEEESITHKYYNSSTKPKFYKNTRLIGKIIEKTSLANFYSKTHVT